MAAGPQESHQDEPDEPNSASRREFIRKAAYSAPVLIALGSLSHIQNAAAQNGSGPIFCPPPNAPGHPPGGCPP